MSILIKGMEMPKDGELLCINIHPDGKVCINLDLECEKVGEAVPVPAHGRLIDGDAFEEFIRKDWDKADHWIAEVVYSRPTIIPAEESTQKDGGHNEAPSGPYDLLYEEGGPDA